MKNFIIFGALALAACGPATGQETHGTAGPMQPRPSILKAQPPAVDSVQQQIDQAQKNLNAADKILKDVSVQAGVACYIYRLDDFKPHISCIKTFKAHN